MEALETDSTARSVGDLGKVRAESAMEGSDWDPEILEMTW